MEKREADLSQARQGVRKGRFVLSISLRNRFLTELLVAKRELITLRVVQTFAGSLTLKNSPLTSLREISKSAAYVFCSKVGPSARYDSRDTARLIQRLGICPS
ncbi:uncharacterized [Tachysurus ichikawai]